MLVADCSRRCYDVLCFQRGIEVHQAMQIVLHMGHCMAVAGAAATLDARCLLGKLPPLQQLLCTAVAYLHRVYWYCADTLHSYLEDVLCANCGVCGCVAAPPPQGWMSQLATLTMMHLRSLLSCSAPS